MMSSGKRNTEFTNHKRSDHSKYVSFLALGGSGELEAPWDSQDPESWKVHFGRLERNNRV
jgi:hypothetical protein